MGPKKQSEVLSNGGIPGAEGYRELLEALELDGKRIGPLAMDAIQKIDQMLDDDLLFSRKNLDAIRMLARESVVNVPALVDDEHQNKTNYECGDEHNISRTAHLVIKCNERLEKLVEHVKYEAFLLTENAEKIRGLIDLNVLQKSKGVNCDMQLSWKNELVQMQGQISSNCMDILSYYQDRSDIGEHILKQPRVSDHWAQLIEIDEDFFSKLRMTLYNLRLFNFRLYTIVIKSFE